MVCNPITSTSFLAEAFETMCWWNVVHELMKNVDIKTQRPEKKKKKNIELLRTNSSLLYAICAQ